MITQVVIQKPSYDNFRLAELTKNNIILFPSPALKTKVAAEMEKIWTLPEDNDESVVYSTTAPQETIHLDAEKPNIRCLPTTIAHLSDGQKFIFTVEPAFLYTAKDWYDVWFVSEQDNKITCHAFCEFVDSKKVWEQGLDALYANFVNGVYGCYRSHNENKGEYTHAHSECYSK